MVDSAASVAAQDSRRMSVIDHHDGAVFFGSVAQRRQWADIAIHGKDAIGDEELSPGKVFDAVQLLFGVSGVFVAEYQNLGARETATINDRGVVELVGNNEIVFPQQRRNGSCVGGEARLKDDAGFDVLEASDFFFQLHVNLHRACDGAHGSGANTVFARGFQCGFTEFGVRGQAEVVVRSQIDHLLAVKGADGGLFVIENTQTEVGAFGLEFIQLVR